MAETHIGYRLWPIGNCDLRHLRSGNHEIHETHERGSLPPDLGLGFVYLVCFVVKNAFA